MAYSHRFRWPARRISAASMSTISRSTASSFSSTRSKTISPIPRELRLEIRKTVIHELAHHFGYTERDLDPFESKDDPFGDAD